MLRLLAWLLIATNLFVLAWTQGWLSPMLLPPMASEREPERMTQQVRPESITFLGPQAAAEAKRAQERERAGSDVATPAASSNSASSSIDRR